MDHPEDTKLYKVVNKEKPFHVPYCWELLTDKELTDYEEYKKTPEYLGRNPEEIQAKKRIPEQKKLQGFVNLKQIGDPISKTERIETESGPEIRQYSEFQFAVPQGEIVITGKQAKALWKYRKQPIKQRIQPGERTAKVFYEGFLEFIEVEEKNSK